MSGIIGKPLPRVDARERVSGSAAYTLDLMFERMLHAVILRCPFAHALVKSVDTSAARDMPGVQATLTGADREAKAPFPYPWWVEDGVPTVLFDPRCRYAGEEVAAVVAETPRQAREAAKSIRVEYEELPFVLDPEKALDLGGPAVHEKGNLVRSPQLVEIGDVSKGFSESDMVLEETYRTSCQIHTPVEVHGSIARWDGDRLTVWDPTQSLFWLQKHLSAFLGLPLSSIRVVSPWVGGSFGSKAELSKHTLIAALLSRKTGRPVKVALTREESFLCVGNRPESTITLRTGVRRDGRLTAFHLRSRGAVGAYTDWADVGFSLGRVYFPALRAEQTEVYVNAGKSRAFRGPGAVQGAWALEQMVDALAEKVGQDPVDFRLENLRYLERLEATSSGLRECLVQGARAFGWKEARERPRPAGPVRRGVGVAAGAWRVEGGPPTTVLVTLLQDGSVTLNMADDDKGTGTKTVMTMVVAEELGVPLSRIRIEHADTATTLYGKPGGGSHSVVVYGTAVRAAAVEVKGILLEIASHELSCPIHGLVLRDGMVAPAGAPEKGRPLSGLNGLRKLESITGIGHAAPDPPTKKVVSFAAHFAEVEVNTRTGEVKVVRVVAAHDSGRVMNRLTYESQVIGGVTMGIGFALTERRVLDERTGRVVNANWHDYKVPTAMDVPAEIVCLPIDPHDTECNSLGAKGLGEIATIPTAPAIANAIHHATSVRVAEAPVTPMRLLAALARQAGA